MITKTRKYLPQDIKNAQVTKPLIELVSYNRQNIEDGYHPFFIVILILTIHIISFYIDYEPILNQITTRDYDGYWHLLQGRKLI